MSRNKKIIASIVIAYGTLLPMYGVPLSTYESIWAVIPGQKAAKTSVNTIFSITSDRKENKIIFAGSNKFKTLIKQDDNSVHITILKAELHKIIASPSYNWSAKLAAPFLAIKSIELIELPHHRVIVDLKFIENIETKITQTNDNKLIISFRKLKDPIETMQKAIINKSNFIENNETERVLITKEKRNLHTYYIEEIKEKNNPKDICRNYFDINETKIVKKPIKKELEDTTPIKLEPSYENIEIKTKFIETKNTEEPVKNKFIDDDNFERSNKLVSPTPTSEEDFSSQDFIGEKAIISDESAISLESEVISPFIPDKNLPDPPQNTLEISKLSFTPYPSSNHISDKEEEKALNIIEKDIPPPAITYSDSTSRNLNVNQTPSNTTTYTTFEDQYTTLLTMGKNLFREGNYENALLSFIAAKNIDPEQIEPYEYIAKINLLKRNFIEAITALEKAYQLGCTTCTTICSLADSNYDIGNYEKAMQYYTECIEIAETSEETSSFLYMYYYNIANTYAKQNNNNLAKEYYLKSINRNPEFADNYYNIALINLDQGNYQEAIRYFETYLAKNENPEEQRKTRNILEKLYPIVRQTNDLSS